VAWLLRLPQVREEEERELEPVSPLASGWKRPEVLALAGLDAAGLWEWDGQPETAPEMVRAPELEPVAAAMPPPDCALVAGQSAEWTVAAEWTVPAARMERAWLRPVLALKLALEPVGRLSPVLEPSRIAPSQSPAGADTEEEKGLAEA
jgi:hypothetical protein